MIGQILENIAGLCMESLELYADIVFGSDPPFNGIAMSQASGRPFDTHLNKGMQYIIPVVLNGKNTDQKLLLNTIESIHTLLSRTLDYTNISTGEAQVINIETTAAPSIIGREQNSQWVCGSSFDITLYWRKE